jgi:hypothetical protein
VCAASSKGVAQSIIQSAGISFVVGRQQRIKLMCKPSEGGVSHASCFRMFACVSHSLPASLLKNISQKDNSTLIFKRTLSAWVPGKALPQRDRSLEYRLNLKFKRPTLAGNMAAPGTGASMAQCNKWRSRLPTVSFKRHATSACERASIILSSRSRNCFGRAVSRNRKSSIQKIARVKRFALRGASCNF